MAVVYAVMLEFGLNRTDYGKTILAACFINDLLTVLALGLIFAPFTVKTLVFGGGSLAAFTILPWLTPRFFRWYGGRPSELEAKFLLMTLFGLGALAAWADSEAVLPAYMVGMVLAGTVGKDHQLIRRLRTLTFGLLTPFYFIRAGSFVAVPALVAAPLAFVILLGAKMVTKFTGVFPTTRLFKGPRRESMYTTLLMSTGLTFGTISSLFGLSHHIISQAQYSLLVAAVIGSAVVPTLIANALYLPNICCRTKNETMTVRIGRVGLASFRPATEYVSANFFKKFWPRYPLRECPLAFRPESPRLPLHPAN